MGTNYYVTEKQPCACCNRPYEQLHIGKSSAGWCFSLHIIPDLGLTDADSWLAFCSKDGVVIQNEYHQTVTLNELIDVICKRSWRSSKDVPYGYKSWRQFYEQNGAVPGPFGLCRHKIDGVHCIAHGDQTWDAITGEFC